MAPAWAAGEWRVPEAALRYKVELDRKPTHASAGYVAQLPDGGILKNTTPFPVVMTDDGKPCVSSLLWQNPETGFSLVFADPGAGAKFVYVYIRNDKLAQFWSASSGLTPSGLLCVQSGTDKLSAAQALGKFGHVDAQVHVEFKAGIPKAPLSIGGDDTGRPRPGAFYQIAYLEAPETGKYWVAPFFRDGQGEVYVDGTKLVPKERSKKWGGTGASFDLTKGLHRFETYQTAPGQGPYATDYNKGGLEYLTWLPPKETLKQDDARIVRENEIVKSGTASVLGIESRDGVPVACAQVQPTLNYWFEGEEPLIITNLKALPGTNSPDTQYTWSLPDGGVVANPATEWIFPGFREYRVKLTARSAKGVSQCVVPLFAFSTFPTSLNNPKHREAFRNVLAGMLTAYPAAPDPVANWGEAFWNNLLRTVEQGEGYPLLKQLFTTRFETVRKKLAPAQLYALEDVLLDTVQRDNAKDALAWLPKFATGADAARQGELSLRQAELQMFYLGDRKAAGTILSALAAQTSELAERAKVRLGDLAFIEGDLNKATSYYADVQNRARTRRNNSPAAQGGLVTNQLLAGGAAKLAANTPEWKNAPLAIQPGAPAGTASGTAERPAGALQEVSLSENVRTLIEGDFLLEAKQALAEWEREFPLGKISSDFIVREAALEMKLKDYQRARPMLEAYCREIDASSFLPDASKMLITCVKQANQPTDEIRPIIEKVLGRLKYHPVAAKLQAFLGTGVAPTATPAGKRK